MPAIIRIGKANFRKKTCLQKAWNYILCSYYSSIQKANLRWKKIKSELELQNQHSTKNEVFH